MAEHWRHISDNWHMFLIAAQARQFNLSQLFGAAALALMGAMAGTYNTTRDLTLEVRHMNERLVAVSAEVKAVQEANQRHSERNAERITRLEVQAENYAQSSMGADRRPR